MKLTRLVRWQLVVFAVLTVVSVVYGTVTYVASVGSPASDRIAWSPSSTPPAAFTRPDW